MQEGNTEYFQIETGVRKGCILSPFLFLLVIDFIMKATVDKSRYGLRWHELDQQQQQHRRWPCLVCTMNINRKDYSFKCNNCQQLVQGKCSGITRREYTRDWTCPKCIREPQHELLTDLDFADDTALVAESREGIQQLTNDVACLASKLRLRMSHEKTKVMSLCSAESNQTHVKIGMQAVEDVTSFPYLGSILAVDGGTDEDVRVRIGKAAAVFRKMGNIWKCAKITKGIKLRLYNSIVISNYDILK